jgi:hypothetical protein
MRDHSKGHPVYTYLPAHGCCRHKIQARAFEAAHGSFLVRQYLRNATPRQQIYMVHWKGGTVLTNVAQHQELYLCHACSTNQAETSMSADASGWMRIGGTIPSMHHVMIMGGGQVGAEGLMTYKQREDQAA